MENNITTKNIFPVAISGYDIGSASYRYDFGYFKGLNVVGTNTVTVDATTTNTGSASFAVVGNASGSNTSGSNYGGYFVGLNKPSNYGVYGSAETGTNATANTGVYGIGRYGTYSVGVFGDAPGGGTYDIGVLGRYGTTWQNPYLNDLAGYFIGNVEITGYVRSNGGGTFLSDTYVNGTVYGNSVALLNTLETSGVSIYGTALDNTLSNSAAMIKGVSTHTFIATYSYIGPTSSSKTRVLKVENYFCFGGHAFVVDIRTDNSPDTAAATLSIDNNYDLLGSCKITITHFAADDDITIGVICFGRPFDYIDTGSISQISIE